MRTRPTPARWALSFADLCLLLLGFFVILQAQRGQAGTTGPAVAHDRPAGAGGFAAAGLFMAGEAVFRPGAADRLALIGAQAGTRRIVVESSGADAATRRFDSWELAAARTAAVARAVAQGGIDPARIELVMTPARTPGAQVIAVRTF